MERNRWYKDKVFYQVWPRSFKDGNGDGMGDLLGVLRCLFNTHFNLKDTA